MRPRAIHTSLAGLVLIVAFGTAAAAGDKPTARWSLKGSDLAVWDVFIPPESEFYGERERPRQLALGLYGYQIDRDGEAHFPAHIVEEIAYDLALRVPVGKVKQDQKVRMAVRYMHVREHWPIDVTVTGSILDLSKESFRFEGEVAGSPTPKFTGPYVEQRKWLTRISGDIEVVFDLEQGIITSSMVGLQATIKPREDAWKDKVPDSKEESHRFRFKLREIRRYDPEWVDKPWKLNTPVGHAILKGMQWLREEIQSDGTYGEYQKYPHGETCLAALTLLICGAERDDPFITDLMDKVRSFQPTNTYEISIALMAMEAFYAPADEVSEVHSGRRAVPLRREVEGKDRVWMERLTDRLISISERRAKGLGWGYSRETQRADLSNTQYAALGLLSAWRCGVKIPHEIWAGLGKGVLQHQTAGEKQTLIIQRVGESDRRTRTRTRKSGGKVTTARGFAYAPGGAQAKASMTCGGISTLQIVRDILRAEKSPHLRTLEKSLDDAIEQGWAWTARYWIIQRHAPDHGRGWMLYYLYSLERAGVLCGVRRINGHDWYHEGAIWLLATQEDDGHWQERTNDVHHTCFALLFLKLGTIPISIPEPTGAGR